MPAQFDEFSIKRDAKANALSYDEQWLTLISDIDIYIHIFCYWIDFIKFYWKFNLFYKIDMRFVCLYAASDWLKSFFIRDWLVE